MDSASQFMAQQSLYPNSPMSIQPMPSFHNYAGNLAMSVPTPVSPSCEPVKTYPPPSTPPSSFQSAHKSTPTPPKSKTKAKPAATPSTPLDLSLDSLPPLSPEDGDKPFFIFEQQEPPPEVAPPRGSFGRTVATAVPNATITSMDSAPALFNPSLPSPAIQPRSQPPRSIHSSSASIHSFSAGFQRLPYATPPYTSPAASPQATFFDQAGYFDYPHSHQSYVSDHMTRDMPSFSRPITTSTSSLTGWAG
ncbi:hypothetical protein ONZ45_g17701 [Pleurotus djamor]|nr:hypothetical protein ONZ45_g17701 [Pleurotus djamor]